VKRITVIKTLEDQEQVVIDATGIGIVRGYESLEDREPIVGADQMDKANISHARPPSR
jgi:hypothetical protein